MDALKNQPTPETKLHFLDYWRIIRIRKTVILAVFLLVVITATLVTFILPESFSSTARIRVERDQSDISPMFSAQPNLSFYDPYFIQTEFEVIQSQVILGKVIDELDLNKVWGKKYGQVLKTDETMELLKRQMDLRPVRNTSIIEIRVYDESPEQAARLANKVADTYRDYRKEQRQALTGGGIDALIKQYEVQQLRVAEAQSNVDRLRIELKVQDTIASESVPTMLLSAETLRKVEGLRLESQAEYVHSKVLVDKLKNLSPDDLAQAIPTSGIQDALLTELLQQLTLVQQKLVAARRDLGKQNSELQKLDAQETDLKTKINDRTKGFLLGLQARVDSLGQGLNDLSNEVTKATQTDIDKASSTAPYFQAKRELEERIRFRQMLYLKIETEKTDLDLPKTSMVAIVDKAMPGLRPVRPNKVLNITLGVVIGLIVGVGLAFFIEYLDTSVKTIDDVERSLGSPVLGVIPQNVGILINEGAESPHAEAYRVLRTNLLFSRKDDKLNTVAVVSAGAGEGKSTTVFNLAAIFAQSGQRVLMVDSDLRRPTLHKMLKVTNNIGLTNYLLKQNSLEEVIQTTGLPSLDFMASGKLPSSSLGILSSAQMRDLITELKQHYDYVFFDSPPVMGVSDASILASEVDMTLQVIQYRRYPQPMNIRAKQLIEKVGGNLVGIVLNNINMSQDESYYYYSGYYHDYYYTRSEDQEPASEKTAPSSNGNDQTTTDKDKLNIKQKY
ncbi:MAG TPA: polysaccharide biosynthesis tyrosine autokinase [Candidatus Limnocylindrales bacterium]|nr:polysaccharide biosynthesis tyrosine autokinase [Candidatus Limnocylindrales bacterium]